MAATRIGSTSLFPRDRRFIATVKLPEKWEKVIENNGKYFDRNNLCRFSRERTIKIKFTPDNSTSSQRLFGSSEETAKGANT